MTTGLHARFDSRVLGAIRRYPGERAVDLAARLDVEVPLVVASLHRLKRSRAVRRFGNTRATTYRPAKVRA